MRYQHGYAVDKDKDSIYDVLRTMRTLIHYVELSFRRTRGSRDKRSEEQREDVSVGGFGMKQVLVEWPCPCTDQKTKA